MDIFNRVNSGGTKLSQGDLALAKICGTRPDARDEMKEVLSEYEKAGFKLDLDWLLRCVNTVLTGEAKWEKGGQDPPDDICLSFFSCGAR